MTLRLRRLNSDTRFKIVTELLAAAENGEGIALSPHQLLNIVGLLADHDLKPGLYLEAVVRQLGGSVHVDTRHLAEATGDGWEYTRDLRAGHGGVVKLTEEATVASIR